MWKAPKIKEIIEYIKIVQPLGIKEDFKITDIDPKDPSGHWNFLIQHKDKKYVFRVIGNETPAQCNEIEKEYKMLKYVKPHGVAPEPYYFDKSGFIKPVLFEEYLEGKPFSDYSPDEQKKYFPEVVKLIAKINKIPIAEEIKPYLDNKSDYSVNIEKWHNKLNDISKDSRCDNLRKKIEELLPMAEKVLHEKYQPILDKAPRVFVFESAHIGHCFVVKEILRFINWEEVAFGDPSFSLSVFLASIENRPDFEEIKLQMTREYLKLNPIENFEKLVEGRLFERAVSNTIWVLWAYILRKDLRCPEEATSAKLRLEKLKKLIEII
ncbi:phosphotransferase [Patescibacteria group bacterium]|nr:phosphotransferase [Patescibacteria group bacterium]MBU4353654.1 phosphotransferase [Patescibacteria group bacterium]MBU4476886.1 phosphotransferase [Patescibacteria group bacterium]MCG2699093.1 aminoglycoside phosphotransferase family protein [Candidatus Parcubacteria bacterium]